MSSSIDASKVLANLKTAAVKVIDGVGEGLLVGGEHVLGVSNAQAPIEDGDLIRSGAVSQDGATKRTAISYDTEYAVRQHEDMSLKHDSGRNAKFLEKAINSERDKVLQIVATTAKGKFS
ncbi:hypothetical protein PBI_APPA_16 [Microbacterium phage Appa]|uniref:Minor capsid protein n=1 Tax=Microbacterium phage Appa TaxID=2182350 RepID=A0A2U8UHV4_9CAUD|nr:hypothetical protein HOT26_gp16 [Microbacterium phage Appa]AWN03198.1 hypothetical protein PBI_APPA_16 [Microbacterium phage Appa]